MSARFVLRILVAGRQRYVVPFRFEEGDAVEAMLGDLWLSVQGDGRAVAFVEDGNIRHFLKGAHAPERKEIPA